MKKIFFLILFLLIGWKSAQAHYSLCVDLGPQFVYQPEHHVWSTGVSVPVYFKFYQSKNFVYTFLMSYGFNYVPFQFDVNWFDPVSYSTQSASFDTKYYYHTIVFGPGFEYFFKFNWQKEDRKYLKYLHPYVGTTFNFNFILIGQNYTKLSGSLPTYLEDKYASQIASLPPTIGCSLYAGTKIAVKKRFIDVKLQYSVLIPESKTSAQFINHFLQIFVGFETYLPDQWFTLKK